MVVALSASEQGLKQGLLFRDCARTQMRDRLARPFAKLEIRSIKCRCTCQLKRCRLAEQHNPTLHFCKSHPEQHSEADAPNTGNRIWWLPSQHPQAANLVELPLEYLESVAHSILVDGRNSYQLHGSSAIQLRRVSGFGLRVRSP